MAVITTELRAVPEISLSTKPTIFCREIQKKWGARGDSELRILKNTKISLPYNPVYYSGICPRIEHPTSQIPTQPCSQMFYSQ